MDYRVLFDAVPGLYLILTPDLAIAAVNDAFARATMIDKAAVIGRNLFDVFPDNPSDPGADGVRNLRLSLGRVLLLRMPDAMPVQRYDISAADGAFVERHWSAVNTPIFDDKGAIRWIIHRVEDVTDLIRDNPGSSGWDQVVRDQRHIIEEMRAMNRDLARALEDNRRLNRERQYLADIVASSSDAIIARTNDGRIASWNRAAERMYGYAPEEVLGQPVSILAPAIKAADADEIAARLERGESVSQYETTRRHRDGSEFHVSLSAFPVRDTAGQLTGTSAIVRDITERRRAEEKLHRLQTELVHLSRWNTMGMMAASLSHELNQPLTAVTNYVHAARRILAGVSDPAAARAGEHLDAAVEETKLAGDIVRTLKDFIDKREARRHPQNINAVIEEAVSLSLLGLSVTGLRTRLDLDPMLPPVAIDKVQIQQVVLNLVRNAVEALAGRADGCVTIASGADKPGFVGVWIADNGPGLEPEIAARLFQPFTTTKETGMGIGLNICQSIIEAHGGDIWATEASPSGACFRFRLPAGIKDD